MISKIRKVGVKYSFAILFNRVVPEWLFRMRRYVVYEVGVQKLQAARQRLGEGSGVEFSACQTEAETQAVEKLTWFKREFSTGDCRAFQASLDGQLVAGLWVASKAFDENELGVRLILNDQQAWVFAALVAEQVRGKGVYGQLLPYVVDQVSQKFPRVMLAVNPDNRPSNAIHKKWASRTVGVVVAVRFLGFAACWVRGQVRKNQTFSLQAKNQPIELTLE